MSARLRSNFRCCSSARLRCVLALSLLSLSACQSKLPGPTECETLALRVVSVRGAAQLRDPRVRQLVEEVTHRCITMPFDREMLRCVEETGSFQRCLIDLAARHPELHATIGK